MRKMTTLAQILALPLSVLAATHAHAEEHCLSQHLKDAIRLNHSRFDKYSNLTHGESERISRRLMRFEKLGLLPAAFIDLQSRPLQKKGIPIICDELVSMSTVPEFSEQGPVPADPIELFHPINAHEIAQSIRDAYHAEGFDGVRRASQEWLRVTNQTPTYHCLVRHFLDSVVRAANLAPIHIEQSKPANESRASARLSWEFIEMQLFGLAEMEKIDELAAPLQAQGIPILCQDVPQIPPR
jgi:hypothetical protein